MHLEKIKLAGFKSFVDPTTVLFPSNLVGVVGPNGCGKSNVIDAVRWVMGESSAKMLRGESMADVIFNGSTSRKPVGTASIELMFDNSDGSAGGQYVQYNQISVKRQVSRDGQSSYFLNGTRCRRRDITDLFRGTGLGPRSYSIIEQGMISRLIEARPEDLRLFLEEAAGISKYKDRRRETENRMRHTRDNLERLDDVREEVSKQLHHLERQAATAEKYKRLRQEQQGLKAELGALRWQALDQENEREQRRLAEQETALEARLAAQRRLEAELEEDRQVQAEIGERFNEVQAQFYAVGAEIARLEQAIQYQRDTRRRQEQELAQAERAWSDAEAHRERDQALLSELERELARDEPQLVGAEAQAGEAARELQEAEQRMHAWQSRWDAFNEEAIRPAQMAQVERTRLTHLEQQVVAAERRLERMGEELARLETRGLASDIEEREAREVEWQERSLVLEERQAAVDERLQELRLQQGVAQQHLDDARTALHRAKGRFASLEALQQAALAKPERKLAAWLEAQGLNHASRLVEHLEVEARWRRAVEVVLAGDLQALGTDALDEHAAACDGLEQGPMTLLDAAVSRRADSDPGAQRLSARVAAPWPLDSLLSGIYTAEDLPEALARRSALRDGESLVTPRGIRVGPNWLRVPGRVRAADGVLERADELKRLGARIDQLETEGAQLAGALDRERETQRRAEQEREAVQQELVQAHRELAQLRSELTGRRTRLEHLEQRRAALLEERAEVDQQRVEAREEIETTRLGLHAALEEIEEFAGRRDALLGQRDELRAVLESLRAQANQAGQRAHRLAVTVEGRRTARESTARALARVCDQLGQLAEQRQALRLALQTAAEPMAEQAAQLEQQLTRRLEVERELAEVRERLEHIESRLRHLEQERHRLELDVQTERQVLDRLRLQHQEILVRRQTQLEQLRADGCDLAALLQRLPANATEQEWQKRGEQVAARIERLGAINLAAIDEFREQSERMRYLDDQHEDISRALETLAEAIRKIDRETRTRFRETFDQVNRGLQQLFPRLFGGGHAYLELTGEDLLDTGVAVMARPPGKRNSSIHLLSGGEKALTAVALVFAIFQLNPAPFCMLDEVDAPLDDANVSRYCELVRSMSEQVQFIFITHNKVTMELADQLIGVTMHEPGVSRLVSVDVEEAAQIAVM